MKYQINPLISVILPVYNADRYLEEAILSILNQTYRNFEFIIVCSVPTETTTQILKKCQTADPRVIVHYQEKKGIVCARNYGCHLARGEYIAVMDADDIATPERLITQLIFLQENPPIGVVGSCVDIIDEDGNFIRTHRLPTEPAFIGWHLFLGNCIMHSSVLMHTEIMRELQYYSDRGDGFPEDYDLWTRAFFITKMANISRSLTKYRIHQKNTSSGTIWKEKNIQFRNAIRNTMIQRFLPDSFQKYWINTGLNNSEWVFSFDRIHNESQVELLVTLYREYLLKNSLSYREKSKIKIYIGGYLILYSVLMVHHSVRKSCLLIIKSFSFLNIGAILFLYTQYEQLLNLFRNTPMWSGDEF